jgi:hypothetical protein
LDNNCHISISRRTLIKISNHYVGKISVEEGVVDLETDGSSDEEENECADDISI